jgi:hypothetical protein
VARITGTLHEDLRRFIISLSSSYNENCFRIIRIKTQQYALSVPLLYFYVLAPTCFGSSLLLVFSSNTSDMHGMDIKLFQNKVVEKIKTLILFSIFFPLTNRAVGKTG